MSVADPEKLIMRQQSNITDQCLDIILIKNTAPGRHKSLLTIENAIRYFFITEAIGLIGVSVVHWHNAHETRHNAITIALDTVTDLAILLVELHTYLWIPHQLMFAASQKTHVGYQCFNL